MDIRRLLIPIFGLAFVILIAMAFMGNRGGRQKTPQQAQVPTTPYLVAKRDIPRNEAVGMNDYEQKNLTADEAAQKVPADVINDTKALIGGRAIVDIKAGDFFTPTNFEPAPNQVSQKVEPGFVAVTIPAPPQPSLYDLDFLNPDDRVDVFGVTTVQETMESISVLLASNVRVLARDKVYSKEIEEKRRADLQREIDDLKKAKDEAAKRQPPASAEELKSYEDQIKAKQDQLDAKPENPSVTVEVTPAQAQKIALWRQTADLNLALHREEDFRWVLYGDAMTTLPGATGAAGAAAQARGQATAWLTVDDVIPLKDRNPTRYFQRLDEERRVAEQNDSKQLLTWENKVRAKQLEVQYRNLERYGQVTPPIEAPAPPPPAPVVVPQATADTARLRELERRVREAERRAAEAARAQQRPPAATSTIEVYRGKEKSVVNY